ncbi:MAG: NAD+ synthase [Micrococcaceae bacterium]
MTTLRLALAQINPTVGDFDGNRKKILDYVGKAAQQDVDVLAFGEMVITGYPVEDLALRSSFVDASVETVTKLAQDIKDAGFGSMPVIVGYLDRSKRDNPALGKPKGSPLNRAAVIHEGKIAATYSKHHLPNYGVFDEVRNFVPGNNLTVFRTNGVDIALAICEDIWQEGGPVAQIPGSGADLTIALNGSPYERNKDDVRKELVARRAKESNTSFAYVNLVGAQDDLVFDGDTIIVDPEGQLLARAPQFYEHLLITDLDIDTTKEKAPAESTKGEKIIHVDLETEPHQHETKLENEIARSVDDLQEVYSALVIGLRDYVQKNGMEKVVLGLSGGIDSALVAVIAADAIGGENVIGVSMPSVYSSEGSKDDAKDLAERIGADYRVQPIKDLVDVFQDQLGLTGVAEENLQARVRGVIVMGISNQEGPLALATGNKTEWSVGYSTIYGDSVGGFAPIKDVEKTLVWQLAKWRNKVAENNDEKPPIPETSITKPPSAELREDQVDQDSLPEYDVLDAILRRYVVEAKGKHELIDSGFNEATVEKVVALVDRAEWKRRQAAPGTKITSMSFGRDRRFPITSQWREQDS